MIIADFYELARPFCESNFLEAAAKLFWELGYIENAEIINRSETPESWVYDLIGYQVYLSEEERFCIRQMEEAAELATADFKGENMVRLFAIKLAPHAERSQTAYQLQKVLSKGVGKYSIILFAQETENGRNCMFSVDSGNDIILSDWLSVNDDADKLLSVMGENLTCSSAGEFQRDFAYHIGRSYYGCFPRHAMRFELLQYASLVYQLPDGACDWHRLRDDAEKLQYQDVYKYGDDFIEPCPGDGNTAEDTEISADILFVDGFTTAPEDVVPEVYSSAVENREKDETDLLIEQLGGSLLDPIDPLSILEGKSMATKATISPDSKVAEEISVVSENLSIDEGSIVVQKTDKENAATDEGMYSLFSDDMLNETASTDDFSPSFSEENSSNAEVTAARESEVLLGNLFDEAAKGIPEEPEDTITVAEEQKNDAADMLSTPVSDIEILVDEVGRESDDSAFPAESESVDTKEGVFAEEHISCLKEELHQISAMLEEQLAKQRILEDKQKALESKVKNLEKSKAFSFSRAWKRLTSVFSRGRNARGNIDVNLENMKKALLVNTHQLEQVKEEIERQEQEKNRIANELEKFEL